MVHFFSSVMFMLIFLFVIAGLDPAIHKHKALAHDMHIESNAFQQMFAPQPMLRSSWPQLVIPVHFCFPLSFPCLARESVKEIFVCKFPTALGPFRPVGLELRL